MIQTKIENQGEYEVIKVGDIVSIDPYYFDKSYMYPYDDDFVNNLDVTSIDKTRYCYSVSNPPLNTHYIVLAKNGNKAYIQTEGGRFRCYVIATMILNKVNE